MLFVLDLAHSHPTRNNSLTHTHPKLLLYCANQPDRTLLFVIVHHHHQQSQPTFLRDGVSSFFPFEENHFLPDSLRNFACVCVSMIICYTLVRGKGRKRWEISGSHLRRLSNPEWKFRCQFSGVERQISDAGNSFLFFEHE